MPDKRVHEGDAPGPVRTRLARIRRGLLWPGAADPSRPCQMSAENLTLGPRSRRKLVDSFAPTPIPSVPQGAQVNGLQNGSGWAQTQDAQREIRQPGAAL
jgi:hypothetical protein